MGIVKNDWGAIIQAVSTDTNSNVLATPSVTTMDNEEASMIVGQEVPIITGSQVAQITLTHSKQLNVKKWV